MLDDKTVLITGAGGALGRSVANRAAALGARLLLVDIIETGHFEGDAEHDYFQLDLADTDAVASAVAGMGDIDAVFNIVGGFDMGTPVHDTPDAQWDFLFDINVSTMRNVVKAVVPRMIDRGRGTIVNVGALGALSGAADMGSYCASKSVVMRLTESLSAELKRRGINVNAVLPGVMDTPANRAAMPDADTADWVSPEDLANVICFLGSDLSRAVHGALVPVAGLG